jgi:four helix bundle protein
VCTVEAVMGDHGEPYFSHEKLEVYQQGLRFMAWLTPLMESATRWGDTKDQLDRASGSIPLNIAEGNGKFSPKDRSRFFDNAHGSALECAACLDTLVAKTKLTREQVHEGKVILQGIVRMLMGLIKANVDRGYRRGGDSKDD